MAQIPEMVTILIVEDDEGDQILLKAIFSKLHSSIKLDIVSNGQEAMDRLNDAINSASGIRLPDLILLDLNVPILDGKSVLYEIRANPDLSFLPVIILSTSDYSKDIRECYQLGANSYVVKPLEYNDLKSSLEQIISYWFGLNKLPSGR